MSSEAITWAMRNVWATDGGNAAALLLYLAMRHRPGECLDGSYRQLAAELGARSGNTIQTAARKLAKLGLVQVISDRRRRRGQTVFKLNLEIEIEVNEAGEITLSGRGTVPKIDTDATRDVSQFLIHEQDSERTERIKNRDRSYQKSIHPKEEEERERAALDLAAKKRAAFREFWDYRGRVTDADVAEAEARGACFWDGERFRKGRAA